MKHFFLLNPILEIINKDNKINYLYIKSKMAFKSAFLTLSKLIEWVKIHLEQNFKSSITKGRIVISLFPNCYTIKPVIDSKYAKYL
ncbi:hypothetical protein RclHR1_06370013 [Rhizophagus clarus]|uniref:Uncharacterized protein n=1 Tax=Rhizophagus clarus TaxID=94130 RepID=A0A2Z6RRX1_9GLOM|nr:hypothetical protein RclHR1_06370013 [Rhizophagus clarus]GES76191.1 hypothetical protein RCL_e22976_RclHR1_06370013 [Rhizophagus clarus]